MAADVHADETVTRMKDWFRHVLSYPKTEVFFMDKRAFAVMEAVMRRRQAGERG